MRIREQKGRLYLHGRFPKKDGTSGSAQYMVTLQLDDCPAGRKEAERYLKKAEKQLQANQWNWDEWKINRSSAPGSDSDGPLTWQRAIRKLYRKKVTLGRCKETSWHVNYMGTLKLMPMTEVVTTDALEAQLNRYERDTYTYKKLYYLLKDIANLSGVPFPEVGIPLYSRSTSVYEIPDDQFIIDWVLNSPEPYRWYFGMMAAYGLRPHEIDECKVVESNDLLLVQVPDETKTGYRTVIPCSEDWPELFRITERTTRPESEREPTRNDATSVWLNRMRNKQKIDYKPYMLRHAYAARLWREGGSELTIDTAAKLMGHSVKEHLETYRRWIDPNQIAVAAVEAIRRNKAKKLEAAERSIKQSAAPL